MSVDTPVKVESKPAAVTQEQPVLSFSRIIELAPGTTSFSGWGVRVSGPAGLLKTWN